MTFLCNQSKPFEQFWYGANSHALRTRKIQLHNDEVRGDILKPQILKSILNCVKSID